jgi:alkanesulfonate monooxygenase SsuD/methylene tetrahydromethanopterin reductase-like flavin-dependent oxidoreductase (luciferase family)
LVDEAVLADQLGVDVFLVGEHHRPEYSESARRQCWPAWPPAPHTSALDPE